MAAPDRVLPILSSPALHRRFETLESYLDRAGSGYALLPFRFIRLDGSRYVLTSFVGEYVLLDRGDLQRLVDHDLDLHSDTYNELKSKHFLLDSDSEVAIDLLAAKYRTKQGLLSHLTGLFLFVVTLRCDHSCPYCQVSRQSADRHAYDMAEECAAKAVDLMFESPSPTLKVEFQGGEPLLNFELIRFIVRRVEDRNCAAQRAVQFVITTNLAFLTDDMLDFCREHDILISTSLDGPRELHNRNRPRPGADSYEKTVDGIRRVREALGSDRIAALMTTTEASLQQPVEIINEYVRQGFSSIFLRSMSPFGFAVRTGLLGRYNVDNWLDFYRTSLAYVLELNEQDVAFREEYSSLLLRKILTPFPTSYVDLQSPAGTGLSCLAFNYDGDVYASDEARMLAEVGDRRFRLGNVLDQSYPALLLSDELVDTLLQTMTEGMPMCSDCGFQPYCGSDPVYHYATQRDVVGFKPSSDFCRKQMGVLRHLIRLLEDDPKAARILNSWI